MAEAIAVTFCLSSVVLAGSSARCDDAEVSAGACGGPKAETAAVMDLEARSLDLSAGEDGAAAGEGDVTAGKGGNGAETAMPKKGASQCDEKRKVDKQFSNHQASGRNEKAIFQHFSSKQLLSGLI